MLLVSVQVRALQARTGQGISGQGISGQGRASQVRASMAGDLHVYNRQPCQRLSGKSNRPGVSSRTGDMSVVYRELAFLSTVQKWLSIVQTLVPKSDARSVVHKDIAGDSTLNLFL